ncbi:MAG: O-antigen ligase family protein [Elusimicrobiales bacterium]|nr:O-antigen ligase family protein [Elusimicrobiales bacterium]
MNKDPDLNYSFPVRALFVAGAVAVVLAATPYRLFDLDRFFAPKELVLHATALALALLGLRRAKTLELSRVDLPLALYLALTFASALFAADRWLSTRALAVTLSGAVMFWASRAAAETGARRTIVAAAAAAAVAGAAASLAQAYGVSSELFSLNRIPGGTLGNRNFMAHLAALGAPALILAAITARRNWAAVCGSAGLAIITCALVLSRSRAAYLGLAAGAAVIGFGLWRAGRFRSAPETMLRIKSLVLAAALGILAALLLPNTLEWRSGSPYLDTVSGIVNYHKGSGHGRLVQYGRTLRIAAAHPLLGAGPGNWAVAYPKFVADYDPSINYNTGRTINPWPSSDWVAIVSERGFPALAAILLALLGLLAAAWKRAGQAADIGEYMEGLALASALAVTAVVASFDAVLLLPAASLIAWTLFGALAPPAPALRSVALTPRLRRRLVLTAALLGCAAVLRSAGQIAAMALFSRAHTAAQFRHAGWLDPGSDKIRARAALQQR